jgi:transcriptional regulator with XRE-family HTH domain
VYHPFVLKQQKTLLRHLRRLREISLDQLRADTGINVSTLSRVERRLIDPTPDQRDALAKYFDVPASDLLSDAPQAVA